MAEPNQKRAHQRAVGFQTAARHFFGYAFAFAQIVVLLPAGFVIRAVFDVDEFEIFARLDGQALAVQAFFDELGIAHQNREGQFLRHDLLRGMQYAFVFAFGQHDALDVFARLVEHRTHEQAGFVNKLGQFFRIGFQVGNRTGGHAGIHRGFGDGRGDAGNQARVERFGNQVFRAEGQFRVAVCAGHLRAGFSHCQIGNRAHTGQFHFFVDGGRTHVQRAAEDEREAQDVVYLIREVGTAGADNHVGAGFFGFGRPDFGLRVGQCQYDGADGHGFQHFGT